MLLYTGPVCMCVFFELPLVTFLPQFVCEVEPDVDESLERGVGPSRSSVTTSAPKGPGLQGKSSR